MEKRFWIIVALIIVCQFSVAQTENHSNMQITLKNGTKIIVGPNDLQEIIFEGDSLCISGNIIESLQDSINKMRVEIDSLKRNITVCKEAIGKSCDSLVVSIGKDGYYIDLLGKENADTYFAITAPFQVKKGQEITVVAKGYGSLVGMICKKVSNHYYEVCVSSIDAAKRSYTYIADSEGEYVASYYKNGGIDITITGNNVIGRIEPLIPEFDFKSKLFYPFKFGIIGDSMASGASSNGSTVDDHIQNAWWKVLEKDSGKTYERFCAGGMTTRRWISDTTYGLAKAQLESNFCDIYVIGLGINDRALDGGGYIGSIADIELDNCSNNNDTYYGNYARIIQEITSVNPNAKFMCLTDPRAYDNDPYNIAVRHISMLFGNAYLVDLFADYHHLFFNGYFNVMKDNTNHYSPMAYAAMGQILEYAISNVIYNNISDFQYFNFR